MSNIERITQITVEQEGEEPIAIPIGSSVDLIDYDNTYTLQSILGSGGASLVENDSNIIAELAKINNDLNEKDTLINDLQDTLTQIQQTITNTNTSVEELKQFRSILNSLVEEKMNATKITINNILWNNGWREGQNVNLTLQQVLGNLINFPGGVDTLRDWIESVETRLAKIPAGTDGMDDDDWDTGIIIS